MPELPEVETVVRTLENSVVGKTIQDIIVFREKTIDGDAIKFRNSLLNQTITSMSRVGKFIIFHLTNKFVIISHLRMEGKYFFREKEVPISKHDLVIFIFKDSTTLTYNDVRRFGTIKLSNEDKYLQEPPLNNVGPDPFMMNNINRLKTSFKNKNIPIKSALLDQSVMSGLGNIYVDEVLYRCKINPFKKAENVTDNELKLILKNSQEVLATAIKNKGSTIKSYHPSENESGNYQNSLLAYGKKDTKCPRCGHYFVKSKINGRGTTYCPYCQKDENKPYVLAISGPIASGKSIVSSYLQDKGYIYYNADEIIHEFYKDKDIIKKIKEIIPSLKIKNKEIDRESLKEVLIQNKAIKNTLESFLYKELYEYIKTEIKKYSHNDKIVLEVPLLFKAKLDDFADDIILLTVEDKLRKKRLKDRNGETKSYLKLNESYFKQENKEKASLILENNGDLNSLYQKIDQFIYGK